MSSEQSEQSKFGSQYYAQLNAYMERPDVQRAVYTTLSSRALGRRTDPAVLRAEGEQLGFVFADEGPRCVMVSGGGAGMAMVPSGDGMVLFRAFPAGGKEEACRALASSMAVPGPT